MGYMIEISEDKVEGLAEHAKKILKHGKKLIECIEELSEGSMGERSNGGYYGGGRYGGRYGGYYGNRYGERDEDWEEEMMGERQGVRGTGPYSRFRR